MKKMIIEKLLRHGLNALSAMLIAKYALNPDTVTPITESLFLAISGFLGLTGSVAWSFSAGKKALNGENVSRETSESLAVTIEEPYVIGKGFFLGDRSLAALEGVHPDLVNVIQKAIAFAPYDFTVVEGLRTYERQRVLKDSGASLTMNSKHIKQKDGYGHAVDLYVFDSLRPNGIDGRISTYAELNNHIQAVADDMGVRIKWGGTFKRANGKPFVDGHHWEIVV